MPTSSLEGSSPRGWALQIPKQLTGRQPEWLTTSFGLGYIGIGHAAQAKCAVNGNLASFALYGLCVALGVITSKLVRRLTDRLIERGVKADRIPRIFGAFIVLGGWIVGTLPGSSVVPAAAHQWTAQWLWIASGALLVLLAAIGEALVCWFPATESEPVVLAAPAPAAAPARRPGWWRPRPDTV
ncbi:hypothetical protein [Streptomyces mirabilis]|uniref:hypothetical protein n=1 Tax=Streptomyces mirabilis TaxID=68239 RepID=UPI002258A451|nr:hypothetical protein [Streptomyces mirabilis]MCX5346654.1 hypothetical protein [Streptomyces mirabilis]MCZ1004111.1 hypothetical protein [Streptomyces mirabilis]